MIRDKNKEKRLEFCNELLVTQDDFSDVVFTDEVLFNYLGIIQSADTKEVPFNH